MNNRIVRIGSRESVLAVIQSELVIKEIKRVCPDVETELVTMKTTGDMILDRSLEQIGGKGLFVKELDRALLEGRCDLTVHSLKDMPMELPEGLPILAYSEREDKRDVLVLRKGLEELPAEPVIGTFSRRRRMQAAKLYPDAEFKGIRGNLVTRLRKLDDGEYDALILAAAGLLRMGYGGRISRYFSVDEIIPSAGQGIMAVQGRKDDGTVSFTKRVNSPKSQAMAAAERAFVRILDGGCSSPCAACAEVEDGRIVLKGLYHDEITNRYITGTAEDTLGNEEKLGVKLALSLKKAFAEGKIE
ncbi:hydroxymethylbilane synthase [Clostridium transplantifaecale]|uniref:hydroxymethylbilane synthase n=1 Tax=Clostridium transplantifaecale TaxID=2479838 RepID=UPI000F63A42F|nr:hydroxymethylbilane synthase [Clostridium transplantifaecale]